MSKRKFAAKSPLQYWIDELIFFRRDFVLLTTAEPQVVGRELQGLAYEKQGCWRTRRIIVSLTQEHGEQLFEIKSEQPNEDGYHQSAKVSGNIFRDDDGQTVVQGSIKMGTWGMWFGLLIPAILLFGLVPSTEISDHIPVLLIQMTFVILIVMVWAQAYGDRNHLYQIIQRAVEISRFKS